MNENRRRCVLVEVVGMVVSGSPSGDFRRSDIQIYLDGFESLLRTTTGNERCSMYK